MRSRSVSLPVLAGLALLVTSATSASGGEAPSAWEAESPLLPLPQAPLGLDVDLAALPYRPTPEKVRLGRWLFYDKRLSRDGTVACASCHLPQHAFSEPTAHSTGVGGKTGTRKAPSIVNAALSLFPVFFHDGRAGSLQEQAKGPMANPLEMANDHPNVVRTVAAAAGYRKAFRAAYGDDQIDIDRIADAIVCYEATRLSGDSAWDRFEAGDTAALTAAQQQGRELFLGKARCAECHVSGASFTDSQFHNVGVGFDAKKGAGKTGAAALAAFSDPGRFAVTKQEADAGAFKTPTLRDVSLHAPYMHDGSLATLRDVVLHYDKGGVPNPWLDPSVGELKLAPAEVDALVAFLEGLVGKGYLDEPPKTFPQ